MYDDPGLPQLEHTLQRFTNLKIFGHGLVFWSEIAKLETPGERGFIFNLSGGQVGILTKRQVREEGVVPKVLRRYSNLYGDLSDGTAYNTFARDADGVGAEIYGGISGGFISRLGGMPCKSFIAWSLSNIQALIFDLSSASGIRLWISATDAFGVVVRITYFLTPSYS